MGVPKGKLIKVALKVLPRHRSTRPPNRFLGMRPKAIYGKSMDGAVCPSAPEGRELARMKGARQVLGVMGFGNGGC